jgi:hypothetical protein
MTKPKSKKTVKDDLRIVIEYLSVEQAQKVIEFILELRKTEAREKEGAKKP